MKGLIFTDFIKLVEKRFSRQEADAWLESCELPGGRTYAAAGEYPYREFMELVMHLSARTGETLAIILHDFGRHLAAQALRREAPDSGDALAELARLVGNDFRNLLTPNQVTSRDAILDIEMGESRVEITCHAPRPIADILAGMIERVAEESSDLIHIARRPLSESADHFAVQVERVNRENPLPTMEEMTL